MRNRFYKRVALAVLAVFLCCVVFPFLAATPGAGASESSEVRIVLTIGSTEVMVGSKTSTLDATPFIRDNRTYVPVRFIAESMGAKVGWVQTEQKVTIELNKNVIWLWIGKKTAQVNGIEKDLDAPPVIENNRTFVPVRFVTENLGAAVSWNAHDQTVTISFDKDNLFIPVAPGTPTIAWPESPSTPTFVSWWMPSDDQIREAIQKGESFAKADDLIRYLFLNYGCDLSGGGSAPPPYLQNVVFLVTPYAQVVLDTFVLKTNVDMSLDSEFRFELAKASAAVASRNVGVMLIGYGDKTHLLEHYLCSLSIMGGKTVDPGHWITLMTQSPLIQGYPPGESKGAAMMWQFDSTQISREAKVEIQVTTPSKQMQAYFNLGTLK